MQPADEHIRLPPRIAVVQHGDYAQACRLISEQKPETYAGQRYTIESLDRFFGPIEHLIISLDGASGEVRQGSGRYVCRPPRRIRGLPVRVGMHWAARNILADLNRFDPTHLLLRCTNRIGCDVLAWANRRRIPTAVITAMRFDSQSSDCRRFCALANDDNVELVANHLRVATASMSACGLRQGKAVAYDFPARVHPENYAAKSAPAGRTVILLFAGVVSEPKGALDVLRAGERLRDAGRQIKLTFLGDGPARPQILSHAGISNGWIVSPGRVSNQDVTEQMRQADIVIVPSRPEFPEAMPLVIAEGLAVRTPLVLSDHPIFVEYFTDGQGVRFFPAGNWAALAEVIAALLDRPAEYEALSRASADAWNSFQVDTKFHHLLERITGLWNIADAARDGHAAVGLTSAR